MWETFNLQIQERRSKVNIKMKLVEEQIKRPQYIQNLPSQNGLVENQSFLQPFKKFQRSVTLSIIIHFIRFIYVTIVYYFSDIFLRSSKGSSQPWSSLIYLLAMMIEIIKFIGDCSLRNLLRNEQKKLRQIHKIKSKSIQRQEINRNITLKAAKYEDYMFLFSIVRIFKYEHKNYSSAFSMSKQLHFVCTFLLFSWMSFRQQTSQYAGWIQFFVLGIFVYSIYFTSFEMDLFMIQTSEGLFPNPSGYQTSQLTQTEAQMVRKQFYDWRNQYVFFCITGSISILAATILQFSINFLTIGSLILLMINYKSIRMEQEIYKQSRNVIKQMKRQTINTYSLLNRSTSKLYLQHKIFIIVQRAAVLWFFFLFTSQTDLSLLSFSFYAFGILTFLTGQAKKFQTGNKLKLMTILQDTYSKSTTITFETVTEPQCAICLNPLLQGEKVRLLPCSKDHIYHRVCFDDWKKIKKQCPLCRYSLQEYI